MPSQTTATLMTESTAPLEDLCSYSIYPPPTLQTDLSTFLSDVLSFALSLSGGYIWHRDAFALEVGDGCLKGESRVGDAIEDEWFIVWLLVRITKQWDGTAAQIHDADGEFLLIEAAEALPKWISPENASNRVWLYQAQLQLVPLKHTSAASPSLDEEDAQSYLGPSDAVTLVRDPSVSTVASQEIQEAAFSRTEKYPEAIQTQAHHTLAYVPQDIARALQSNEQFIAPTVAAFYERDPLQLKACQQMRRFSPNTAQLTRVKMTRTLYAQLLGQRFYPPKPFERVKWFENVEKESKEWRRRDVGMKVSCGFEMLYEETRHSVKTSKPFEQVDATSALESDPAFKRFLGNITNLGYFQGELPGSQKYTELLRKAESHWRDMRADGQASPSFAEQVESALSTSVEALPPSGQLEEDSDDWMATDEEGLEALLQSRAGRQRPDDDDEPEMQDQAQKLGGLAEKFEAFVQGKGDLEGALFDDEMDSDAADSDDEDADEAMPSKTAEEKQKDQDALVAPLPESEWGQKEVPPSAATDTPNIPPASAKANDISEPRLEPERYEGASDDSSEASDLDEDDDAAPGNIREIQEEPEVDMSGEMHDFLKFTREALGLSEDQYADILQSRKERGAFVPGDAPAVQAGPSQQMDIDDLPPAAPRATAAQPQATSNSVNKGFHLQAPQKNPRLDNFEALMDAMDGVLAQAQADAQPNKAAPSAKKPAPPSQPLDNEDTAMETELAELLKHDPDDPDDHLNAGQYHLLKNLLASFDSQEGMAGPVSNLAGRLAPDVALPRNQE